jgi:cytochrome c oxidase cbb3-type subunit I/II
MPQYPWLFKEKTDFGVLRKKLSVMKALGVPYTDEEIENAPNAALVEAKAITDGMKDAGVNENMHDKQIVALISYLQRLGKYKE